MDETFGAKLVNSGAIVSDSLLKKVVFVQNYPLQPS